MTTSLSTKATKVLIDARTEWAVRWTTLTLLCYAFLFYLPRRDGTASSWIDWTLPIQLVQGGNLGFYNAGWHYYFGMAATLGLVMGGCLTSIIFPLLQRDNIVGGYLALMTMVTVLVTPCAAHLGVLSNPTGLTLLVMIIFVENIYVPVLDLRLVLPDVTAIWSEVIRGSAVAALVYVGLSWGIYAIPPWHAGTTQALRLASATAGGIANTLRAAADEIRQYKSQVGDNGTSESAKGSDELKAKLRQLGAALFQGTNCAGLSVPVNLYGSMGAYEVSPLYPLTSLDLATVETLSSRLDEASYHCSVVLSILGHTKALDCCLGNDIDNDSCAELRHALAGHLEASANLAEASSVIMQVERREGCIEDYEHNTKTKSCSRREQIYLNASLWEWNDTATCNSDAMKAYDQSQKECLDAVNAFKENVDMRSALKDYASLLWATTRDTSYGSRPLAHFMNDEFTSEEKVAETIKITNNAGALGRLGYAATELQRSWNTKYAFARQIKRSLMLEHAMQLVQTWCRGLAEVFSHARSLLSDRRGSVMPLLQRRAFRRAVQWMVGTWSLFAMATWWEDFRTMFGSSSTGPWTMVAFFVCFRPSVEETINTAVLRSIGHGLGAVLSWAVNAHVSSSGLLMLIHGVITFVITWMIPTPFTYPSSIFFPFDATVGTGLLEGLLTTYHLVSSVVLSADPASAAKARAISQCIGSTAAAVVSATILPWWAEPRAKKALREFHTMIDDVFETRLQKDDFKGSERQVAASVNELLTCQRELSSVSESKWLGGILRSFGFLGASETEAIRQQLLAATFGGVALESVLCHMSKESTVNTYGRIRLLPEVAEAFLSPCNPPRSAKIFLEAISSAPSDEVAEIYATCHIAFTIMKKSGVFSSKDNNEIE